VGEQIKSVLRPEEVDILLSSPPPPGSLRYSRETELTDKNGRKRTIGFTAMNRIDNKGKKVGTIVSFRDISELKQMQSQVIRMDRLASLGVLASGIAHEIKNPLAGIKTMAQACEEEFEGEDSRQEYLIRIIRQVNRLDDLLKTFFAFARPKPPDRKYHTLPEILQEVTNLVGKKMSSSGIDYIEQIDTALPAIMVDAQQIQQVLLNLILNSIDAMPDGGELKITAQKISSQEARLIRKQPKAEKDMNGAYVQIKCMDTGVGIDPDKLEIIFDPFFTTKPNGLGLGLSIVYRIIEEHDGDIRADSNIGQGTTFTVTLPTGE
jgi:signal transduction histidine kinase